MFTAETVDGTIMSTGKTLVIAHDGAVEYMRNHREVKEAFICNNDCSEVSIMRRPKIMNLYFPVERIENLW
jgi:hypothetical protein